jgi:adenylyl-sulfate kinase
MNSDMKGRIIWLFGRPGSGKTTTAIELCEILKKIGHQIITLDGDEFRKGINKDLGYSIEDRQENIRRATEVAKLLASKGFWVICSFITPTNQLREFVLEICENIDIEMFYLDATVDTCINRDVKGNYRKALSGEIKCFTGISAPFEEPSSAIECSTIDTSNLPIQRAVEHLLQLIVKGKFPHFLINDHTSFQY